MSRRRPGGCPPAARTPDPDWPLPLSHWPERPKPHGGRAGHDLRPAIAPPVPGQPTLLPYQDGPGAQPPFQNTQTWGRPTALNPAASPKTTNGAAETAGPTNTSRPSPHKPGRHTRVLPPPMIPCAASPTRLQNMRGRPPQHASPTGNTGEAAAQRAAAGPLHKGTARPSHLLKCACVAAPRTVLQAQHSGRRAPDRPRHTLSYRCRRPPKTPAGIPKAHGIHRSTDSLLKCGCTRASICLAAFMLYGEHSQYLRTDAAERESAGLQTYFLSPVCVVRRLIMASWV